MKDVSIRSILKISATGVLLLLNTACGSGSWVNNASLTTSTQNGDIYGKISVDLGTSGLLFPTMSVPILDPKNPGTIIGGVSLVGGSATAAQLSISVDLTRVAQLPKTGSSATLPNGQPLPIAGVNPANLLVFNVGGNKSEVYVEMDPTKKQGMVGVAVPIQQFDAIGQATGGLINIMPSFRVGNGVTGTAGLFTSVNAGQNGFALFLDMSSLLQQITIPSISTLSVKTAGTALPPHQYLSVSQGSQSSQMKAYYKIYQLANKGVQLKVSK